jgi:protein phosphatase
MTIVKEIKEYLNSWIIDGTPADSFKDINFNNKINMARKIVKLSHKDRVVDEIYNSFGSETIVYILGLYLYFDITSKKYNSTLDNEVIKRPRIYQFLNMVLKQEKNKRETNPQILLSIFNFGPRDIIEEIIESENYKVELFSTLGLTRLTNQDFLGAIELNNVLGLVVADGVGGEESGEIASKIVIDFTIDNLRQNFSSDLDDNSILTFLKDTIYVANEKIIEYANNNNISMMGTTLSIALIIDKINLYIAHIGDSRIYELDNELTVRQITQDHSVVEVLFRSNKITKEQKKEYKKSILAFVLGKKNLKRDNIFTQKSILYDNSRLLLCSDGFWEKIDVTRESFNKPMDLLKNEIYNTIPDDNVTVIRYIPKISRINIVDNIYEDYDETEEIERIETEKRVKYRTNRKISKREIITYRVNYIRNVFILVIIISSITFFILNFFTSQ